jgi:hypothetical protein
MTRFRRTGFARLSKSDSPEYPMPWFRHHFYCEACDGTWLAEAAQIGEADCPFCGTRDALPYRSDDRTRVIEQHAGKFVVFELSKKAGGNADYRRLRSFATRAAAAAFVAGR